LPALCAGLMLAACSRADSEPLATSALPEPKWVIGERESGPHGNSGNTVAFATDSAELTPEAQALLQMQVNWLRNYARYNVTFEGHADERGTREYNLALGERRADTVMRYFIALGIDPKRLKTISYGKERPACTDPDEGCWSLNRRVVSTLDQQPRVFLAPGTT
jgi:peptidoglycan-associated lipoprotein